ncbi:MADS-box transcription factor [Trifolium pratense]|uniref:Uncharacterized protein n=2 Tax=Trifolium pratense TaxID=57577 RepID=A0ACB0KHU7_TRIPR|nr:agamous-like MADS-box protein AGL62 [Trifolium pratense]PNX83700.1 MADS-box transcription factor [Trifolium pratense]CAJ2655353.1 unnamed protein product [Trifolium pratense]
MSSGKKTRGRQKVDMKKISKESDLHVTFSKRRNGLIKKANELFALCGAYVALIVFSPSGKVFSFGHPDVYTIIERFLSGVQPPINGIRQFIEATRNASARGRNAELTLLNDALEIEKRRGDDLSHLCRIIEDPSWWTSPIDGLNLNQAQLELLKAALEEVNKHVGQQADQLVNLDAPTQTEQAQMMPAEFFQNPMLQPDLLGFNNMQGWEYGGPSGSF